MHNDMAYQQGRDSKGHFVRRVKTSLTAERVTWFFAGVAACAAVEISRAVHALADLFVLWQYSLVDSFFKLLQ